MFPLYLDYSKLFTPEQVIGYGRKSRTDDATLTVEEVLEKHEIRVDEWCEQNLGAKIPEENKFREVVSGEKISERPEFNKVLKLIENPQYKAIICFDTARISRGDLEDAGRLIKLLRYTSTYVITVSPFEFYDLSLERDRDLFERALKRGNEYLEYFKKISKNGKDISCSQGNYIGSAPPYGYDKVTVTVDKKQCPTLVINEEQAEVVRLIFDLYVNQNMGCRSICRYLEEMKITAPRSKCWNPDSINRILKNVVYLGKIKLNYKKVINVVEDGVIKQKRPIAKDGEYQIFDGKHEAIISEDMFNSARTKRGTHHRTKVTNTLRNPLAGIVFCQKCGRSMLYTNSRLTCPSASCENASVSIDIVIKRVCDILQECLEDFEFSLQNDDSNNSIMLHSKKIASLEKRIKDLEIKELAQWEQQSHPDPAQRMPAAIFKQLNERLLNEKKEVEEALIVAKESMPKPINYEEKICRFQEALEALKNPDIDAELQNNFLKSCIRKIVYSREKPERIKSQKVIYYDKTTKTTKSKSPLKRGSAWSNPPVILDVILNN